MYLPNALPAILAAGSASSTLLYAAVADGTIQTLNLAGSSLSLSSSIVACGSSPSWLTSTSDLLYCSNEATPGSLSTFSHDSAGKLSQRAISNTTGGDVSSTLYGDSKFVALAHYGHSSISTYALPLTSSSRPLQTLNLPFPGPGPNPRQDKGYPHQVILDPSGKFLFSPDLGADVVRVFSVNGTSGLLTQLPNIKVESGSGPRHVAFYKDASASSPTFVYLVSELTSTLSGYRMDLNSLTGKPNFTQIITPMHTVPSGTNIANTLVAEVRVSGKTLTVSNRGDQSFGSGMDSLTVYTISDDGKLSNMRIYPSGGNWPRSFQLNDKATMVAVGNQYSHSVVVIERNVATGAIGNVVANLTLSGEVIDIVWA